MFILKKYKKQIIIKLYCPIIKIIQIYDTGYIFKDNIQCQQECYKKIALLLAGGIKRTISLEDKLTMNIKSNINVKYFFLSK